MTEVYQIDSATVSEWVRARASREAFWRIDSRQVGAGDVFVALKGTRSDGAAFVEEALQQGAACALVDAACASEYPHTENVLCVDGLFERMGVLASEFYGNPTASMRGVAVTGTNGKTTTSHWLGRLLTQEGVPCAVIGTIGAFFGGEKIPSPALTTPDAASLQSMFADVKERGARSFAIEASSIGLVQSRLAGTHFETAVFTNLTRDHLDYHGSMQRYEEAKGILFAWPGLKNAVINAEDEAGLRFCDTAIRHGVRVIAYSTRECGLKAGVQPLVAKDVRADADGMSFSVLWFGREYAVRSRVLGLFNVSNLLAVAGTMLAMGFDAGAVFGKLAGLTPPVGRLQTVATENCPLAVVDYAHTPDALQKALEALRPNVASRGGKLWVVFGAGGDRDHGKRPMMGKIAAGLADVAVVTSDNPRSEKPEAICTEVASGVRERASVRVIVDRREAIRTAISEAAPEDIVLIAGKGHEDYQEVQGIKHHFSDAEEALGAQQSRLKA